MPPTWTREKLEKLSVKELESLERNVRDRGDPDLGDLCFEVRLSKLPKAAQNKARGILSFERQVAHYLGSLAEDLNKEFDLSAETATAKGTSHPHALTDKLGEAKTGGAMKNGDVALDRYISYKLKKSKVGLAVVLFVDKPTDEAIYFIYGTNDVVANGQRRDDLYLANDEVVTEFSSLENAAIEYRQLLSTLAPRRK
jgi:hypothetical protein